MVWRMSRSELCFLLQRNSSLPDDTNVARLQEELIGVKLREAEALTGLKELRQQVRDLEEHWQVSSAPHAGSSRVCRLLPAPTLRPLLRDTWPGRPAAGRTAPAETR